MRDLFIALGTGAGLFVGVLIVYWLGTDDDSPGPRCDFCGRSLPEDSPLDEYLCDNCARRFP